MLKKISSFIFGDSYFKEMKEREKIGDSLVTEINESGFAINFYRQMYKKYGYIIDEEIPNKYKIKTVYSLYDNRYSKKEIAKLEEFSARNQVLLNYWEQKYIDLDLKRTPELIKEERLLKDKIEEEFEYQQNMALRISLM